MSIYYRLKHEKKEKLKPKKYAKIGSNKIDITYPYRHSPFPERNADFWVANEIKALFLNKHYDLNCFGKNFVSIFLWGHSFLRREKDRADLFNSNSYKICWVYSHPEHFEEKEMKFYDIIFFASKKASRHFASKGIPNISSKTINSFSSFKEPEENKKLERDIVFVANSRSTKEKGRNIVRDLDNNWDVSIWGNKWEKTAINQEWHKGSFFPFWELPNLYKNAKICLNDHRDDHIGWEYVSFRIFDIVKSGGFCISDFNLGVKKIFGDSIVMYKDKQDLNNKIEYFLNHPEERKKKIKKAQRCAKSYTTKNSIEKLLRESGVIK